MDGDKCIDKWNLTVEKNDWDFDRKAVIDILVYDKDSTKVAKNQITIVQKGNDTQEGTVFPTKFDEASLIFSGKFKHTNHHKDEDKDEKWEYEYVDGIQVNVKDLIVSSTKNGLHFSGTYSEEEKTQMMEKKNQLYRDLLSEMNERNVTDEVRSTLEKLREKGLKLAIGSSSKNTAYILERIGLSNFFDDVSDGTIISRSKPDPEVFIKAAGMLHLRNDECIVVEDAKAGIDAAVSGGFASAGLGSAKDYSKCTYHLDSFSDILAVV
jgi:beta-phosphoglucomutase